MTRVIDDSSPRPPPNPAVPIPPRYRWLRRLILAGIAMVIAVTCLRWWWGWEARRRLQAELDSYRAAGQPVSADDLRPDVPDEDNAAILYVQGAGILSTATAAGTGIPDFQMADDAARREMLDDWRELVRLNRKSLELIRQARDRPACVWLPPGVSLAQFSSNVARFTAQRNIAKLLYIAAYQDFHNQDHDALIGRWRDMVAHSEALTEEPTHIGYLVGNASVGLVCASIEQFSAALNAPGISRPAAPEDIRTLIRLLDDETRVRRAAIAALQAERLVACEYFPSRQQTLPAQAVIVEPLFVLDTVRYMRGYTALAEAFAATTFQAACLVMPKRSQAASILQRLSQPWSRWAPDDSNLVGHFRGIAMRRLAAAALAIRLYELHYGHRPQELSELVPEFLARVPVDPFSADQAEIRYLPNAEHAVLYSLGRNGRDDGGTRILLPDGRIDQSRSDLPFYLDGKPGEA